MELYIFFLLLAVCYIVINIHRLKVVAMVVVTFLIALWIDRQ